MYLRQQDLDLFTADGLGFQPADITDYFQMGLDQITNQASPPADMSTEDMTIAIDQSMFATNRLAICYNWSNQVQTLKRASGGNILLLRPPSISGSSSDAKLWYKASMYWSASSRSDHPEAAAKFVDFMVNSPTAGAILGTERGVPPNTTVLDSIQDSLSDTDKQLIAYLQLIEPDLAETPVVTPAGGSIMQQTLQRQVQDLLFGRKSPSEAATDFHDEVAAGLD